MDLLPRPNISLQWKSYASKRDFWFWINYCAIDYILCEVKILSPALIELTSIPGFLLQAAKIPYLKLLRFLISSHWPVHIQSILSFTANTELPINSAPQHITFQRCSALIIIQKVRWNISFHWSTTANLKTVSYWCFCIKFNLEKMA